MPADHNRPSGSALFRDVEANLGALRQRAAALREKRSSWFGGKSDANQPDFGTSLVDTFENLFAELRQTIDAQNGRLTELEREAGEINTLTDAFRELRGRVNQVEAELLQEREKSERLLVEQRDRAAKIESELRDQISQLSHAQGDFPKLANELRDRIQQVLDEQRVCIRQVSLKTSEDAVLADRARRALELRLDALEQRLSETPPK